MNQTEKESRYINIAKELAQRISKGEFPVGSLLPTEMELCETYQASRHTIRDALRELSDIGLVSRKKRIGTRVESIAETPINRAQSLASLEDLVELAKNNVRVVKDIQTRVADSALADLIGCPLGSHWIQIESVREDADNTNAPICITDSYVHASYEKIVELIKSDPYALISDLIEQQYGRRSVEVRQTITAVAINSREAKILHAEEGFPALKIIRHYLDRLGKVIETTVSIHPAGRYTCSIILKRMTKAKI
ncbi:MAG: GntR family transcriptional regulator [[Pasteurella] mairii]|uniref:HTH-type transcriptional repressor yvoA n=1 Tax=[Pasteurella] mairii TaxID=757 RepID=A0A379B6S5_9PAST|nr:GntR family transcriptional regulator [[Pasteurella] mairii]SUB33948.1 HTH-type transcriptional repressor yvoA [[Pasteurella] mairii]